MIERRRKDGLVWFSASSLKDILLSVHCGFFRSGWRMFMFGAALRAGCRPFGGWLSALWALAFVEVG
jgi:hypothetical protein